MNKTVSRRGRHSKEQVGKTVKKFVDFAEMLEKYGSISHVEVVFERSNDIILIQEPGELLQKLNLTQKMDHK